MDSSLLSQLKEELLACESLSAEQREARLDELWRTAPELERELRSLLEQNPFVEPNLTKRGRVV